MRLLVVRKLMGVDMESSALVQFGKVNNPPLL